MPAGPGFSSPLPSGLPGVWGAWTRPVAGLGLGCPAPRRVECYPDRNAVSRSQYWHRSQGRARPWGLGLPGAEAGPQPMEDGGAASPRTRRCIRAGVAVPAPGRGGDVGAREHMTGMGTQPCAEAVASRPRRSPAPGASVAQLLDGRRPMPAVPPPTHRRGNHIKKQQVYKNRK